MGGATAYLGGATAYLVGVEIIRIKAISVRLALNLPTGTELGNYNTLDTNCYICPPMFTAWL